MSDTPLSDLDDGIMIDHEFPAPVITRSRRRVKYWTGISVIAITVIVYLVKRG